MRYRVNVKSSLPEPVSQRIRCGQALLLCLLLLVAPSLRADTNYLAAGHPDGVALLAPPPAPGSEEEAADLASARAVFGGRTPAQEARAFKDSNLSIFLFAPAVGSVLQIGRAHV